MWVRCRPLLLENNMRTKTVMKKVIEDRQFYAQQVPDAWERMISATRTFGFTIVSSRIDLPPNEWRSLVTDECPFDLAVACRVVKFAQGQQIPGVVESSGPYCFYELIHLEEPVFRYGLDYGLLTPTCSPEEISALKKRFKVANG